MDWRKSESLERPLEADTESSKIYNYIRRNISEETRESEDGEKYTAYVYEEATVPKNEWDLYEQSEQNKADIAYVAIMTGVDL